RHAGGRRSARAGGRGARRRSRPLSSRVTEAIASHPLISIRREEITTIPSRAHGPGILATGPLTSDPLSAGIAAVVGSTHLYFYDAISPIVSGESIDRSKVFRASRWGRSLGVRPVACGVDDGEGDYLNCPFTKDEYERFYEALMSAEKAGVHEFDQPT